MKLKYNIAVSLGAAVLFSLFYLFGALTSLEDRFYDFFLRFRADRERIGNVVFLDVDDPAIAHYGVYPWPRSIPAEGLLRLKEYDINAVIFDIEYIDDGPQGIDSLYLAQGLGRDFSDSFSLINTYSRDLFTAIGSGRFSRDLIREYSDILADIIDDQQRTLFEKAQRIARDNDLYLENAIAFNGSAWSTLNLQESLLPADGEQAARRRIAEEHFSYPINASRDAHTGAGFVDVLPALPRFLQVSKGAGYTNVEIDPDGVRRRVYLAQKINDHWYLQLSFAPLINYLGNPEIILTRNRLTIKDAKMPDGTIKDINIPLDVKGRMLLDWPKEDYTDSYTHISFADFSLLDDIETELEYYIRTFESEADLNTFGFLDPSFNYIRLVLRDLTNLYEASHEAKSEAMHNSDEALYNNYRSYCARIFELIDELISLNVYERALQLAETYAPELPADTAEYLFEEADYIFLFTDAIQINNDRRKELNEYFSGVFNNSFVIIGRVDTGTTDYGANPFHPKYINVGTHGVVLDTILSETFILPLGIWWRIIFMLIFIPLIFIATSKFAPIKRAVTGFAAVFVILTAPVLVFRFTGIYWGPLGVIIAMVIAVITREIIEYAGSEKEKQFIRTAFSTYLSGDVVKEIIADPSRLQLGGTKRNMTAIFTDVKAFSTISEKLDPEELVSLLNKYLTAMCDIILDEKGTIDKFEGDAIIAFFGAPIDLPDHALRACVSAVRIKKAEEELNKEIMAHKLAPMPLLTRVGVNTGSMVVGNMGTASKMNYTIMGDSVNLAARLEGVNKQYGTWIMASEDTIKEAGGDRLLYRKLDRVRVVGKSEPVRLCEVIDEAHLASAEDKKRVEIFHKALEHFENRAWMQAAEGFKEALNIKEDDEPAKMYLTRCEQFITEPPQDDWDGVYNLTSK